MPSDKALQTNKGAELVVRQLFGSSMKPEVVAWTKNQIFKPSSDILEKARLALAKIMDENRSELAQLWSESGDLYQKWRSYLTDLSGRLE